MENENQNLNTAPPPVQPVVEPEKPSFFSSKWLKIGIGILILFVILGGSFVLGGKLMNKSQTLAPTPTLTSTPTPTPVDETADWETYENKRFGFNFKIPPDFKLRQELNENRNIEATQETALYQVVIFDSSEKDMALIINLGENSNFPTNEGYGNFIKNNYGNQEFKNLLVDSINAVYYTTLAGGPGQAEPDYHVNVQLARNSKTYDFSLDSNKADGAQEKLLKDMLSTLKFTDSSTETGNDYQSFLENVKAAVATGNTQPLITMQKTAQATCNSEGFHVSNMCDGLPNGSKITGYQLGYWQSEGTILSEADFANNITKYISEQGPFKYLGEKSNEKKAVVVFTNPSKSTLLIFYAQKETTGWKTVVAIEGSSQGFDMNQVTLDFQDY